MEKDSITLERCSQNHIAACPFRWPSSPQAGIFPDPLSIYYVSNHSEVYLQENKSGTNKIKLILLSLLIPIRT